MHLIKAGGLIVLRYSIFRNFFIHSIALYAVFFFLPLCSMELAKKDHCFLVEDIWQGRIIPQLHLKYLVQLSSVCKNFAQLCDPGKLRHLLCGCMELGEDYCRCTPALGRFARCKNKTMFEHFWSFDAAIRSADLARLTNDASNNGDKRMHYYHKYYGSAELVKKNTEQQLIDSINKADVYALSALTQHRYYDIFRLFDDGTRAHAFQQLCTLYDSHVDDNALIKFIPLKKDYKRNRVVQYMCKYGNDAMFCSLFIRRVLKAKECYGHKCTLLHYAALRGFSRLIQLLCEKNADFHAVNEWGKEPLHYKYRFHDFHAHAESQLGSSAVWAPCSSAYCLYAHSFYGKPQKEYVCYKPIAQEEALWIANSCDYTDLLKKDLDGSLS